MTDQPVSSGYLGRKANEFWSGMLAGTQIAVGYLITLIGLAVRALIYCSIVLILLALFVGAIWLVMQIVWAAAYVVIAALTLGTVVVLVGVFAK